MAWGDKKDGDGDREEREPKEVRPFLDAHWSEALRQISHHCGLMDDHIEKYYAKLYNSKNDDSGLKSEEIFPVPQPDLVVRNGVRPAKSIQIVHEENKLFKIKVVIIHYGKDESYFVSNTSARHFFDDALGQEETADGVSRWAIACFLHATNPRCAAHLSRSPCSGPLHADASGPPRREAPRHTLLRPVPSLHQEARPALQVGAGDPRQRARSPRRPPQPRGKQ